MLDGLLYKVTGPVLRADDVYLRPPRLSDWPDWARAREESQAFLAPWEPSWNPDALTRPAFKRRIRRQSEDARNDRAYAFFILSRKTDDLHGAITLSNIRRGVAQTCSAGYWIAARDARQGLMAQALVCLIPWIFDQMAFNRLEAACLPSNQPSQNLLRKCGFTKEGYARRYLCIDGAWRDHLLYAMLHTDPRPAIGLAPNSGSGVAGVCGQ